ncbi:MAG: hypothetical protein ACK4RM_03945 [Flavobacterium sp.]
MSFINKYHYKGSISEVPTQKIYIEIKDLHVGDYEIIITHHKKHLKKITFKKV